MRTAAPLTDTLLPIYPPGVLGGLVAEAAGSRVWPESPMSKSLRAGRWVNPGSLNGIDPKLQIRFFQHYRKELEPHGVFVGTGMLPVKLWLVAIVIGIALVQLSHAPPRP